MPSLDQHIQKYPRLKQYLELKELAIKEVLKERCSILDRRDFHLNSIQNELYANKELLLILGHVVNEEYEGFVMSEDLAKPI